MANSMDSREKKSAYIDGLKDSLLQNQQNSNVNGATSPDNNTTSGGEDYYELLKNESYKTMLSKEVQAYNASEQARKYLGTNLRANGYGSQGASESAMVGIGNTYQNSLRDAQNEYENSLLSIKQQQKEASDADFESFATILSSASSTDQLNNILNNYGYMKDGEWTSDFSKLDAKTQSQIKSLYSLYSSEFDNQSWLSDNTLNGTGYRDSGTAIQSVIAADGSLGSVKNELKEIFSDSYIEKVENTIAKDNGSYAVKLINKSNDGKYVYMIYRNGAWYQTTARAFNNATHKDTLKGL